MSLDNPNGIESSVSKNTKQRRTFLKRASAGAVIASIPGRSAWAGIAGSIVASGHGSDFNQGECTQLLSHGYWKNHTGNWNTISPDASFNTIFGGNPLGRVDGLPVGSDNKLINVLKGKDLDGSNNTDWKGLEDVNVQIIAMLLSADDHGTSTASSSPLGVYYPAVVLHGSLDAYAKYLYREAKDFPASVGILLHDTIENYDVGKTAHCPVI
jgi:hypothetical protein